MKMNITIKSKQNKEVKPVLAKGQQVSGEDEDVSRFRLLKKNKRLVMWLVLLVMSSGLIYGYYSASRKLNILQGSESYSASEDQELVETIRKFFELPDETPQVRTVGDVKDLKGQELFARAKKGDKALIFPKSKRALVFRPSTGKVIEYLPVELK